MVGKSPDGLGITVLGTGGLLVEAKRVGLLTAVAPVLEELIATGFRVDPSTRGPARSHDGQHGSLLYRTGHTRLGASLSARERRRKCA
ncbi:MAG: DUF3368 domain-containing protein [Candidatus Rokubacteria bacterium]|nr:DUF3368 domain-containing protein [Candidatus Rokubacteria bacterium]